MPLVLARGEAVATVGQHGRTRRGVDLVGWALIAAGRALLAFALFLGIVGALQATWADRVTVWAFALSLLPAAAWLLGTGFRRLRSRSPSPSDPVVPTLVPARVWLVALVLALLTLVGDVSRAGLLPVTGDLALLRGDGRIMLVLPLTGDGVAQCATDGQGWPGEWSSPRTDPDWGDLGRSSAFFSARETIQLLGQSGGALIQGRYEGDRWHGPYDVVMNDGRLAGSVRGRPAFWPRFMPEQVYWYFALVPDQAGGLRLFWRYHDWLGWSQRIGGGAEVDAVAAVDDGDEGVRAVVRDGSRLLWSTGPAGTEPGTFERDWSEPEPVELTSGRRLRVTGDPALLRTTVLGSADRPHYAVAVQTAEGLLLLTAEDFEANRWAAERLPVPGPVSSVALVDTAIDGRAALAVAYRVGEVVYVTDRSEGAWRTPELVRCVGG